MDNNNIEKNLEIMETVENELNKQKHDAVFCLTAYGAGTSAWILFVALCEKLDWPLTKVTMTKGVEIIALLMLLFVLKFTRLKLTNMGITTKNLKHSLIKAFIISAVLALIMILLKMSFQPNVKLLSGYAEKPTYLITSIVQEFLARGFLLTTLLSIYPTKKGKHIAIFCSSLLFSTLHLYYGFSFMCAAFVLSIILGYVYEKDKNIWGVSLIHFVVGYLSFLLGL